MSWPFRSISFIMHYKQQQKCVSARVLGVEQMKRAVVTAIALAASLLGFGAMAQAASLVASIDVSSQTMTVSRYGQVIHRWRVSTARRGYITPRGTYRPTRLHRMWYSRKYDMSPMPYSVFFRGGYAIHGTNYVKRLGTPASHGCVRLDTANAAKFYSMVKEVGAANTRIVVTN
jgi:lipoprotein-anchoring transpeptidase ErfK/SrfK